MPKAELTDLEGYRHLDRDLSILFSLDGKRPNAVFLPKSLIEVEVLQEGVLPRVSVTLPISIAKEKGLI